MALANNIIIVSDKKDDILAFCSKLDILRDIDSFIGSNIDGAFKSCKKNIPDSVVFFLHNNDTRIFEICKNIKQDLILKNTPIFCIFDRWDEEFALACFDAGINDFVVQPVNNSELLMRIMWGLQKSVIAREIEKNSVLLNDLGVSDKITGAYKPEFIARVFTNEINTAKKYKYPLSLMAVCLDNQNECNDKNYLSEIINEAIRNSDSFGMPDNDKFFIMLPQTAINGACTVYERIKSKLNENITISAGACESFNNMDYDSLSKLAIEALDNAISNGENNIVIANPEEKKTRKTRKSLGSLLKKIQSNKKDFEKFRYEFNNKVNAIILPVFNKTKDDLKEKYSENIIIDQSITDSKCYFTIKDPDTQNKIQLKIINPGFAKVIIDSIITKSDDQTKKRFAVNLSDLTEENIVKVLQNLVNEFNFMTES